MRLLAYLDLADFALIAEAVLGIDADKVMKIAKIGLADSALHAPQAGFGDIEFVPDLHMKAAVLYSRLQGNQPLPDGNKRVAYAAMKEFLERNGWRLEADEDELFDVLLAVATRDLTEERFAIWLARNTRKGS